MTRSTEIIGPDEQAVRTFMRQLQQAPLPVSPGIPGSDVLLLKLQLIRRWDAERRARLPLDVMEPLEIAASLVAAMLLLFWSVPSAFDWLPRFLF